MVADAVVSQTGPADFGILGPLEVSRSGCVVPLGGPRQRAVLALLVLEANRVVSMDRLAEDVWGGDPPEGWATTLQTYVFHLRRALEPDRARGVSGGVLVTRNHGYLLFVNREHLDAALFQDGFTAGRAALEAGRYTEAAETLREALALWRSPVLADLADYAFIRPEAARLEELRLAALEARIDADLALGRHDALTAELEHLAAEHPLRERLHGQLMLALYRCGRQAEALAAYRRARDLLAGELGIDPGEPLRHLHGSVLAHDPALDWSDGRETVAEVHPAGAGSPAPSPAPQRRRPRPAPGSHVLGWGRRRGHRLLVAGLALVVIAAAAIVAVARPWAGGPAGLPGNSVGLIDTGGGRVGAAVSVGSPAGLAYGDGSVWAVNGTEGTVSRINPATHAVVEQIPVGSAPSAVAITGENVWVTNSGDGTVSRINAAANTVVQTTPVGNVPVAIASGPSGVWVANRGDDTVNRIDPVTGKVTRTVQVGGQPDGIAVGPDAVWVANGEDGTVTRIDPATGQPSGALPVGSGPAGIAITPAAVWVANSLDLTVSKIDPATDRVTATIGVGDGPSTIVAARNALWVSDEFDATLDRIDPRTGQVTRSVFVGSSPQGLAATPSGVWVAARPFAAASHRGGTLTVVSDYLPERDPVQAYDPVGIPALATVYDGLVALRRSGGAAGLTLVPDLAWTLPRPADGGTTYTFTLRRGNPLLQRHARAGVRLPPRHPAPAQLRLLSPLLRRHPRRANVPPAPAAVRPVRRDHHQRRGRHGHLPPGPRRPRFPVQTRADPRRAGPARRPGPRHRPGTVPARHRPLQDLAIPAERVVDPGAEPLLPPMVIRRPASRLPECHPLRPSGQPGKQESAVIAGRADLAATYSSNDQSLATRYPARVHTTLKLWTEYLFLNTRQPPFTSLKARQAVNYAIDRGRILQLSHLAPGQGAVTCQILPADFPGHQGYCPYTTGTKDGIWHGPDMAKARRLAKDSHTTNVPVTVWILKDFASRAVGSYLVRLLKDLGYRAHQRTVSDWPVLPRGRQRPQQDSGRAQRMGRRLPHRIGILPPRPELPLVLPGPHQHPTMPSSATLTPTSWPARRRRHSSPTPPPREGCGPRWIASSPTRHHGSRSSAKEPPHSSPPGPGTTRSPPFTGPLLDQMWVR